MIWSYLPTYLKNKAITDKNNIDLVLFIYLNLQDIVISKITKKLSKIIEML